MVGSYPGGDDDRSLRDQVDQLAAKISEFDELMKDSKSGSLMDAIAKYVVGAGFSEKMRELRHEFYTRAEFKNAELRMASQHDIQKITKESQNMYNVQKAYINDLQET